MSDSASLASRWQSLGLDVATVRVGARGTVVPERTLEGARTLPSTRDVAQEAGGPDVELGRVLGEGGMGVVKLARQRTLARDVAVKSVRPGGDAARARAQLLLEARVTGALDHPNVVPVHVVLHDADAEPLIVMKRIEGRSWGELLAEAPVGPEGRDPAALDRHLEILVQVARAVHYAHSKGVIHRDLKPDNVMIGAFGEVYVVDWGIAVSTREDGVPGLPLARDVREIAGTPEYMAPEMAAGDGASLSPRTDVYLLGAVLHEILTGAPPHEAPTLLARLERAFASEPPVYPRAVPPTLAAVARRAMSFEPALRQADAGELVGALQDHARHRASTLMSSEAEGRLEALEALLANEPAPAGDAADAGARAERTRAVHAVFGECRFGFAQALRLWDGNEAARAGLTRALERMIDFELARGAPTAAESLLAELAAPPAGLVERVRDAVEREAARRAELERVAHDVDTSVGGAAFRVATVVISVAWGLGCIALGVLGRHDVFAIGQRGFGVVCLTVALSLIGIARAARRSLLANAAARRQSYTAILIFLLYAALWLAAPTLGLDAPATSAVAMLAGSALWTTMALLEASWVGLPIGLLAGFALILAWPRFNFEAMGLASLVGGGLAAALRRVLTARRPGH
ncbi:MAG: serine/threonine protein kinase [Myxococcales bacterium]|nr:serine/threonine protein kinase [Myxococcales bacterium]